MIIIILVIPERTRKINKFYFFIVREKKKYQGNQFSKGAFCGNLQRSLTSDIYYFLPGKNI